MPISVPSSGSGLGSLRFNQRRDEKRKTVGAEYHPAGVGAAGGCGQWWERDRPRPSSRGGRRTLAPTPDPRSDLIRACGSKVDYPYVTFDKSG